MFKYSPHSEVLTLLQDISEAVAVKKKEWSKDENDNRQYLLIFNMCKELCLMLYILYLYPHKVITLIFSPSRRKALRFRKFE